MTTNTMEISKQTFNILKNFSGINSNLFVKPGNKITTMSPAKNMMAEVTVEETFDTEFGIWDLNKFLGVVTLFQNPEFTFDDKYVLISGENGSTVKYYFSDPKLLSYPTKSIKKMDGDIAFTLTEDDLTELQRAGAVLQLPDLCFVSEGADVLAVIKDLKDPTCNVYSIKVGDNKTNAEFSFNFKLENMRMFSGDYAVELSKNKIGCFSHQSLDLRYWLSMESTSTYSE